MRELRPAAAVWVHHVNVRLAVLPAAFVCDFRRVRRPDRAGAMVGFVPDPGQLLSSGAVGVDGVEVDSCRYGELAADELLEHDLTAVRRPARVFGPVVCRALPCARWLRQSLDAAAIHVDDENLLCALVATRERQPSAIRGP